MSLFQNAVVQTLERTAQGADGSIPASVIIKEAGQKFIGLAVLTALVAVALSIALWVVGPAYLIPSNLIGLQFVIILVAGIMVGFLFQTLTSSAVHECQRMNEKRAAKLAQAEQRALAVRRDQEQQQRALVAETDSRRRALLEFRFKALKFMEDGLLDILDDARRREEWVPETIDEEHIFAVVRERIKQSGAPEFGILRRSFNPRVVMILGNPSWLPPDPSDDLLASRQLLPVVQLLR